jgi:hypothetical protein
VGNSTFVHYAAAAFIGGAPKYPASIVSFLALLAAIMVLRWVGAVVLQAGSRFRRVRGVSDMPSSAPHWMAIVCLQ